MTIEIAGTSSPKKIEDIKNNTLCLGIKRYIGWYAGSCLRLRRSSDDAEMDFGFIYKVNFIWSKVK